ncbi:MAG: hypothetical protein RL154_689, partial [Pseudomonadota bacterium]
LEAFTTVLYFGLKLANFNYADEVFKIISAVVFSAFGAVALKKISQRRRKVSDASLKLWKIALVFAIIWAILVVVDIFIAIPNKEYLFAIVFGFAFAGTIMVAMLNKITPFLVWFHLTSSGNFDAPNMNELLPPELARLTMKLHIASLVFLFGGYFFEPLIRVAGVFIVLEFSVLFYSILGAARIYNKLR